MIERRIETSGVRIGHGSVYDWAIDEIFAAAGIGAPPADEGEDMEAMAEAMAMLARARKQRVYTRQVEAAIEAVERERRTAKAPTKKRAVRRAR